MKQLEGKRVLVTGATGGLGQAICKSMAEAGATLIVGYHSAREKAENLAAALPGSDHVALAAHVTDSSQLADLQEQIGHRFHGLDILVNCAGITRFVPHADLDGLDDELIDRIFSVNVRGVIAVTRALLPLLQRQPEALIVNISSIAARTAMGSNIAYCASKAAVDNLTQSLARALAPQIRVISIAPGLIDTEFVQSLDTEWRDAQLENTPLGRLASPHEVAQSVVAAATMLTFTTGAVIPVDGGRPLN